MTAARDAFTVISPGRVNLIGEHTDYNDGFVLPMAIDRGLRIAVRPRAGRMAVVSSDRGGPAAEIDLDGPLTAGRTDWGRYVAGVIAGYRRGLFTVLVKPIDPQGLPCRRDHLQIMEVRLANWMGGGAASTIKSTAEFLKGAGRIAKTADDYSKFINPEFAKAAAGK